MLDPHPSGVINEPFVSTVYVDVVRFNCLQQSGERINLTLADFRKLGVYINGTYWFRENLSAPEYSLMIFVTVIYLLCLPRTMNILRIVKNVRLSRNRPGQALGAPAG